MDSGGSDLTDVLAPWLPRQRWFAGKGRPVAGLTIRSDVPVSDLLRHVVVEVRYDDGGPSDTYQVPLVVRRDAPHGHDAFLVGDVPAGRVYDGLRDPDGGAALLTALQNGADVGGLHFHAAETLQTLPAHAVVMEQSNTSIVFGESYILKVFRRLWPGLNPDLEITRALAEAGSPHIARPVAWISGTLDGAETTVALMQEYLRSGSEGWRLALTSVRDLYAEGDLHPDEVGGDFAAEAERLGAATAEVHRLLAQALPTRQGDTETRRATGAQMHARLDEAVDAVEELRPFETALRKAYDALTDSAAAPAGLLQRIHGDFHLGQVLRVDSGWVLFDFEGEPARPVAERTALASPLRDVAGMLRSFDYAAQSLLMEHGATPSLQYRAQEWSERNQAAFCDGYAAVAGSDPRADAALLRAMELDKAVYEVVYEARHRPSWIGIPLGSVERLSQAS